MSDPAHASEPSAPSLSRPLAALTAAALGVGVWLAWTLVFVKLRLEYDPTYISSCNVGEAFNCDAVQTAEQSTVFGHPLALWGMVTYLAAFVAVGLASGRGARARATHQALVLTGLAMCAHSAYLAYLSTVVIGHACLYCMGMYGVNAAVTVFAAVGYRRRHGRLVDLGALTGGLAGPGLALVAWALTIGGGVLWFSGQKDAMEAEALKIAAESGPDFGALADSRVGAGDGPSQPGDGEARSSGPAGDTAQAAATKPAAPTRPAVGDVVTRKGRSYYRVPVEDSDFVLGPADAPVTVVEFADFQCGYCRMLTANFKPLKAKYEGKVRFVFKHFPMMNKCNPVMKGAKHAQACLAARAANCVGDQSNALFWKLHDRLYAQGTTLDAAALRGHAEAVGADMAAYDGCVEANPDGPDDRLRAHSQQGRVAKISGTPRTYINGHLVPGVHSTEVLDYYLSAALEAAEKAGAGKAAPPAMVVKHGMVRSERREGRFWMDRFEASIDAEGRAVSVEGVLPAEASWFEAKAACGAAGKRLCTEEEWVSACTGTPAVDDDGDGEFADDEVEGRLFPYGMFHEGGRCHDQEPKTGGKATRTGQFAKCRTPTGIQDLAGNLAEWTGADEATAAQTGSWFAYGQKASCRGRSMRFGPGYRNSTTGFRCCADEAVPPPADRVALAEHRDLGSDGTELPAFEASAVDGEPLGPDTLKGKVTVLSFFASWCGPCRRELPELKRFAAAEGAKGVQVVAVGVDTESERSRTLAQELGLLDAPHVTIALDPEARVMGRFGVRGMPTAVLVGKDGRIVERLVGANAEKLAAFLQRAVALADGG